MAGKKKSSQCKRCATKGHKEEDCTSNHPGNRISSDDLTAHIRRFDHWPFFNNPNEKLGSETHWLRSHPAPPAPPAPAALTSSLARQTNAPLPVVGLSTPSRPVSATQLVTPSSSRTGQNLSLLSQKTAPPKPAMRETASSFVPGGSSIASQKTASPSVSSKLQSLDIDSSGNSSSGSGRARGGGKVHETNDSHLFVPVNEGEVDSELRQHRPHEKVVMKLETPTNLKLPYYNVHGGDVVDNRLLNNNCVDVVSKDGSNNVLFKYPKYSTKIDLKDEYRNDQIFTNHFQITDLPPFICCYTVKGFKGGSTPRYKRTLLDTMASMWDLLRDHKQQFAFESGDTIFTWDGLELTQGSRPTTQRVPTEESICDSLQRSKVWRDLEISFDRKVDCSLLSISPNNAIRAFRAEHFDGHGRPARQRTEPNTDDDNEPTIISKSDFDMLVRAVNALISKGITEIGPAHAQVFKSGPNKVYFKRFWEDLGANLVTHLGFFFTAKSGLPNALLNFNTVTTPFYRPQYVINYLRDSTWHKNNLIGTKVIIVTGRKSGGGNTSTEGDERWVRTIIGFGKPCEEQEIVAKSEKHGPTLEVFLRQNHQIMLDKKESKLPSVKCSDKQYYAPSQLYVFAYQNYGKVISPDLMPILLLSASRTGDENRRMVNYGCDTLIPNGNPLGSYARGLRLNPDMVKVKPLLLKGPQIKYAQTTQVDQPNPGVWIPRKVSLRLGNTAYKVRYIVQDFSSRQKGDPVGDFTRDGANLASFARQFSTELSAKGINTQKFVHTDVSKFTNMTSLQEAFNKCTPETLIAFMSGGDKPLYSTFRILADCNYGFKAIHMKLTDERKVAASFRDNKLRPYLSNVALKVNLRDRYQVNQRLGVELAGHFPRTVRADQTLILGADVTHPGPGSAGEAMSVAGVVGSLGVGVVFGSYGPSARLQAARAEIIEDLKGMVLERIRAWQTKNNGNLPHNIMYFRDGVSASQYNSLLTYELAHIYEACRVAQITDPKVTIIVTTKRHHVRFYPLIANTERNDRGKNCPAGTLVDQAVTNPWYNDFFLQAQSASGVKGTARPTHYFVLKDDMGWEIRNLQNFINKLCYTYMRSVTSVSYATPAYYADRLCDRLRFYFKHFFEPLHKSKSPNEKAQPHDFRAEWDRLAHLHQDTTRKNPWHPNLDNTMFFL